MSTIDFTMMFTVHDAFRRELRRLADHTGDPNPLGWQLFTRWLTVHHTTEDAVLWPMLAPHPLLDEMAAEHATIDPLLAAVDTALRTGADHRPAAAALRDGLTAHLRHEEEAALPLIDATLTQEEWARFGAAHRDGIGDSADHGVPRYLPWLLDELPGERRQLVLAGLKPEVRTAYETQWQAAYDGLKLWGSA
jgi:hemerythrin HHE cation binding domain-containing protein